MIRALINLIGDLIEESDGREAEASLCIPADIARLVVASRVVAFECQDAEALRELDKASEAFAERVPWDDAPVPALAVGRQRWWRK